MKLTSETAENEVDVLSCWLIRAYPDEDNNEGSFVLSDLIYDLVDSVTDKDRTTELPDNTLEMYVTLSSGTSIELTVCPYNSVNCSVFFAFKLKTNSSDKSSSSSSETHINHESFAMLFLFGFKEC